MVSYKLTFFIRSQFGPGGSCDSQTDSQTPWIDDTVNLDMKRGVDQVDGTVIIS